VGRLPLKAFAVKGEWVLCSAFGSLRELEDPIAAEVDDCAAAVDRYGAVAGPTGDRSWSHVGWERLTQDGRSGDYDPRAIAGRPQVRRGERRPRRLRGGAQT
jgi:hypothetical protein